MDDFFTTPLSSIPDIFVNRKVPIEDTNDVNVLEDDHDKQTDDKGAIEEQALNDDYDDNATRNMRTAEEEDAWPDLTYRNY